MQTLSVIHLTCLAHRERSMSGCLRLVLCHRVPPCKPHSSSPFFTGSRLRPPSVFCFQSVLTENFSGEAKGLQDKWGNYKGPSDLKCLFPSHGPDLEPLCGKRFLFQSLWSRIEEDGVTYQHILPESPQPSASHALSDYEMSEKSSVLSRDQKLDSETGKTSVMANHFSQGKLSFAKHFGRKQGFLV